MMQKRVVESILHDLEIPFEAYEHPPLPTIEEAKKVWEDIDATHCKNLFFRNHKGNRHYLVILDYRYPLDIHDLEKRLSQGKISFASPRRMDKYLGVPAGSVSPFSIINDRDNHVHLFLDKQLQKAERISFHPNDNTWTFVIQMNDFIRFLDWSGNRYEFITLYN